MLQQLANLNWISVLFAFAAYFILGGVWFTLFFSKPYKVSLGKAGETLPVKPIFIAGPALCTLVITISLAIFMYALHVTSLTASLELALVLGIGFLVANTVNIAINPNIPRPILYGIISGAYHITGIVIAAVILFLMK